jgi:hypothetical protein
VVHGELEGFYAVHAILGVRVLHIFFWGEGGMGLGVLLW